MGKLQKELAVLGVTVLGGVVFLFAAGYVSINPPFIFAFSPYVTVTTSGVPQPTGFVGSSLGSSPFVTYSLKPSGLSGTATLQTFTVSARLSPSPKVPFNGLKDFYLSYYGCITNFYGYPQCFSYFAYPSGIIQDGLGTTVTFNPNWPIYGNATQATVTFGGNVAYTVFPSSGTIQTVRAIIPLAAQPIITAGAQLHVFVPTPAGNTLQIRPGYGYPTEVH